MSVSEIKSNLDGTTDIEFSNGLVTKVNALEKESTMLARAASRYKSKYSGSSARLFIGGDSWGAGNGASEGSKSYAGLLSSGFASNFAVSNYGYSGRAISNYAWAPRVSGTGPADAYTITPKLDDIYTAIFGLNDLRGVDTAAQNTGGCGSNPANFPQLATRLQAVATWFLVPETSRVRAHNADNSGPNPSITFAGGAWVHTGYAGNPGFSYGTAANDSATVTTTQGDLLIIRHGVPDSANGSLRIEVDGVVVTERAKQGQYDGAFVMEAIILKLQSKGTHVVKLTQVGNGNLMLHSIDCVDTSTDFSSTLLYSAPMYLTTSAWANTATANSSTANSATGALAWLYDNGGCDRFEQVIDKVMMDLYNLGFNVVPLFVKQGWNPLSHTSTGDALHPNDAGHWHIYNKNQYAISSLIA